VSARRLAAAAIALTALVAVLVSMLGGSDGTLLPSPVPSPSAARPASPAPTPAVTCSAEAGPLPPALATDPCPAAILAVEIAVAPVRLPIERIAIEPGPFYCDDLWPGAGSPRACYGPIVRPGQFMHGWASFVGSEEVAAVALGLDLPDDLDAPGATRPPWNATLVTVEIPPSGWVMP
jgi:hypothetical protein